MITVDLKKPLNIVIETTALCNLRCSMCGRTTTKRTLGHMKREYVFDILDQIAAWDGEHIRVWYCFLGEPLIIHKRLAKYIEYGVCAGIKNNIINTNGILMTPNVTDRLIEAGLTEIYIGIDAATEETYSKIRRGGDFNKVVNNVMYLLRKRPQHLKVTVQMIEMRINRGEKEQFSNFWRDQGANVFCKKELNWTGETGLSQSDDGDKQMRYACPWIIDTMGIYWDGSVPFCVNDWNGRTVFGHIKEHSLVSLWNTQIKSHAKYHLLHQWDNIPSICLSCTDWKGKEQRQVIGLPNFDLST